MFESAAKSTQDTLETVITDAPQWRNRDGHGNYEISGYTRASDTNDDTPDTEGVVSTITKDAVGDLNRLKVSPKQTKTGLNKKAENR